MIHEPEKADLTREEEKALADMMHAFMGSAGWRWFVRQTERMIEAQRRTIENAPLDDTLALRIAESRGAARGMRQMLDFPGNTLSAVVASLNPDPMLGGQPKPKESP
jgi:hypothetical protein